VGAIHKEKGFVLPVTLLIALLVFFVVHHQLQVYVSEALFAQHVRSYYQLEHLMEEAVSAAPRIFAHEGEIGQGKTYVYPQGEVAYTLQSWQNGRMMVKIHCTLSPKLQTKALVEVDTEKSLVTKWEKL
jgi:hypothetical protein